MLQRLFLDTIWLQTYIKIESPQFSVSISDSLAQNHCFHLLRGRRRFKENK